MEHAAAVLLAHRLNLWDSHTGCKNNAVFLTRPPNPAVIDVVVFEAEVGSASSPTSTLCISGGFVLPVCHARKTGPDLCFLVGNEGGCSDPSQCPCSVVQPVVLGQGQTLCPGWFTRG